MTDFYAEQENDELKKNVIKLTHASNAFLGELLYGKEPDVWEESRNNLIEQAYEVLYLLDADLEQVAAERKDFEEWWENFKKNKRGSK